MKLRLLSPVHEAPRHDRPLPRWSAAVVPGATLALALALHGCSAEPAALQRERKLELLHQLQGHLEASVEAEKSAVLAATDDEARAFTQESKQAAAQFEATETALRGQLERDPRTPQLDALRAVDASWGEVKAIDAKLLPMLAENTNRAAAQLAAGHATQMLERLITSLEAIEAATSSPEQLRALSKAKAAALWNQALLAPHIASPLDAEMTALEARFRADAAVVDATLAGLEKDCPAKAKEALATAKEAWSAYQGDTSKIIELSRANSNVHALDLSVHEKRQAVHRAEAALDALSAAIAGDTSRAAR